MKNNINFYPHHATSDQHAKFKMLRVEFGWAGEGKFWALNNRIAQADECCLNVQKKYNKAALASDLGFTMAEFENFIDFLKTDCELIQECSEGVITTDIIQETFGKVMQDRAEARARYRRASGEKEETSGEEVYKGKERKGKENKKDIPYQTIVDMFNTTLAELPTAKMVTPERKMNLKARWNTSEKTKTLKWWDEFFNHILQSDFLMGKTNKPFSCGFDWIIKKGNFVKIIEGNYHGKNT